MAMNKSLINDAIDVLTSARNTIRAPEYWTQGRLAVDKYGQQRSVFSADAYAFCSIGAIKHQDKLQDATSLATRVLAKSAVVRLPSADAPMDDSLTVELFNDDHTTKHSDVIAAFNDAIDTLTEQSRRI